MPRLLSSNVGLRDYRLSKELCAFTGNRLAVRFARSARVLHYNLP